jgi:hypothetical protein
MSAEGVVPTIGRLVDYTLDAYDADAVNKRRAHAMTHLAEYRLRMDGSQLHVGNGVAAGDVFPMMIVRVFGPAPTSPVNGQVFLDGNDIMWVTSVTAGEGRHHFAYIEDGS